MQKPAPAPAFTAVAAGPPRWAARARARCGLDPLAIQLPSAFDALDQVRLEKGPLREGHLARDEERKSPAHVLAPHPASIFHISPAL
jgi:hypothetical protein